MVGCGAGHAGVVLAAAVAGGEVDAMTKPPRCGNCRYWVPYPGSEQGGSCHRNPPDWENSWPPTFSHQWCGEHQPIRDEPHWLEREP
jgi:hypothetical protein